MLNIPLAVLDDLDSANRAMSNAVDRIRDGELDIAIAGLEYAKSELEDALTIIGNAIADYKSREVKNGDSE